MSGPAQTCAGSRTSRAAWSRERLLRVVRFTPPPPGPRQAPRGTRAMRRRRRGAGQPAARASLVDDHLAPRYPATRVAGGRNRRRLLARLAGVVDADDLAVSPGAAFHALADEQGV